MSLDLEQVASPIQKLAQHIKSREREARERLGRALETASALGPDEVALLRERVENSRGKVRWPAAGIGETMFQRYALPPALPDFSVLAVDGSHVEVDRHRSVQCYLINLGRARLDYGQQPGASLSSTPFLYSEEKDLTLKGPGPSSEEEPIEGALLGARRSVEECRALATMAEDAPGEHPVLALLDGSLILWGLTAQPPFVRQALVDNGLIPALDRMRSVSARRPLALASYISSPRSTDVVNALRMHLCPHDVPDCGKHCFTREAKQECQAVGGVADQDLFRHILSPGERSPVFSSSASIVRNCYGPHQVAFFYLHVGEEIARVEAPRWVVDQRSLLDVAHFICFDQCQRGLGYPAALSEAHEQAVVTTADRASFWAMVERAIIEEDLTGQDSAKSRSKLRRWV